jgi:hydroxymethylglutaryl-CoA lyase|tara:strand:+ start:1479 stop:2390 length:912 start_codon:yes stop_codon:yes gene_type:complete
LKFPNKVKVIEVGPRDGLQSLNKWIPTQDKVEMINLLSEAHFPVIEVSSFAHPKIVPMLSDAEKVFERINRRTGTIYRALAPNLKGTIRAIETGMVDEILGLLTVSETYMLKNQNMTLDDAIDSAGKSLQLCEKANINFVMAMGVAFFCPYEGVIPNNKILSVVERLYNKGIRRIYLAASTGMENPSTINQVFNIIRDKWSDIECGFHVHDSIGMAATNMFSALDAGAISIEGSICGIGGGIAMPQETGDIGNLPTEDIVNMLNRSNVDTQLNTNLVSTTADKIASLLNITSSSYISRNKATQ